MHYRITQPSDPDAARVLKDTLTWLANDPDMQRDRTRLVKVCCAPQLPIAIQGAPRPASLVGSQIVIGLKSLSYAFCRFLTSSNVCSIVPRGLSLSSG